jgi:hypothetical protein
VGAEIQRGHEMVVVPSLGGKGQPVQGEKGQHELHHNRVLDEAVHKVEGHLVLPYLEGLFDDIEILLHPQKAVQESHVLGVAIRQRRQFWRRHWFFLGFHTHLRGIFL